MPMLAKLKAALTPLLQTSTGERKLESDLVVGMATRYRAKYDCLASVCTVIEASFMMINYHIWT